MFGGKLTVANGPPGQQEFRDIIRDAVEAGPVTHVNGVHLMREGGELIRLGLGGGLTISATAEGREGVTKKTHTQNRRVGHPD